MTIHLEELEIWTKIGVSEGERANLQKLLVTLTFPIPIPPKDEIEAAVDYAILAEQIQKFAHSHSCKLMETLIVKLADFLQKHFRMCELKLTIKKFVLPECQWVAVTYAR